MGPGRVCVSLRHTMGEVVCARFGLIPLVAREIEWLLIPNSEICDNQFESVAHGFCRGDIKNCLFLSRLNVYIAKEVWKSVVGRSFVRN